ncbi:2-C-methyl-D-erythritol 4-phosphate cytidylyltransferase [Rhodoferax sp. UBA5149]|uniref:2-C-methyl-D-erythritol 4-phosphate cytidylyltransferase n=1 Tax=Rhodoferax sp. UBA5149 TaxID=1947379 RepID=UPI0025EDB2AE|nr:2-C-methyl-D-erythritol 4-phosphate cytidylyltransferase [Rhodoferax sp. UBA5149]
MTDYPKNPPADGTSDPRFWALIPCAGTGSRAGSDGPKQYQLLAGQPMVMHTLAAFASVGRIANTAVVVAEGDDFFASQIATYLIANCGGFTRASSVFNGLEFLLQQGAAAHDWVLVHDAARCLITPGQIDALIDACAADDVGGLLAHKLPDTLKSEVAGRVAGTLDRSDKWLAQTPQMFRIGALADALRLAGDQVTDESSAMEALGLHPLLVPGSAQNFKVTYPEDFALAQAVLIARSRGSALPMTPSTTGLKGE